MSTDFKPRRDSLTAHVVRFFEANPTEGLTKEDIGVKWNVEPETVNVKLDSAVRAGVLEYAPRVYRRGPAAQAIDAPRGESAQFAVIGIDPHTGVVQTVAAPTPENVKEIADAGHLMVRLGKARAHALWGKSVPDPYALARKAINAPLEACDISHDSPFEP
jgi:hypothetical protein